MSVVVPAHNEEREIGRTLSSLLSGAREGEFDIVVVPNGCTDRTAEIARTFPGVRVVETRRPGKAGALRVGSDSCSVYPRLFLDADVRLSTESVRRLRARLDAEDGVLACSPRVRWDFSECGPVARRAQRAHDALVDRHRVLAGVGAYMLGERGCDRVFPLPPDLIADDEYVHRSFGENERRTVPDAVSVTRAAFSFRALVRRRARARAGNRQLEVFRPATARGRLGPSDLLRAVGARRVAVLDGCCFLAVVLAERGLLVWRRASRTGAVWSVDRRSVARGAVR